MKVHDFLVLGFDNSQDTYVAEIVSIDWGNAFLTCRRVDNGNQYTFQFVYATSSWQGSDDTNGGDVTAVTHDIYSGNGTDPVAQYAALVTFADGSRDLCFVQTITPQTTVEFYDPPYATMSFDGLSITASTRDGYPAGGQIQSIEAYFVDNFIVAPVATPTFNNGWWSAATRRDANAGRIGAAINPFAVVVHTTDMLPGEWNALLTSWTTTAGLGDCAHFLIGRDAAAGVIQLMSINNNGNHAGGPGHGQFVAGGQSWHPNEVSVGIEIHCAGQVRLTDGAWRLWEDGAPRGAAIPAADVILDPDRAGYGWHQVTEYQYQQLRLLLDGLETVLQALPAGCVAQSIEAPPAYGIFPTGRRVGHVSLDAANRGDPWTPTCDWVRAL